MAFPTKTTFGISVRSNGNVSTSKFDLWERKIKYATEEMNRELAEEGAKKSIEKATVRKAEAFRGKRKRAEKPIKASIKPSWGRNFARWTVSNRHGLIIEQGGGPSLIKGNVAFFWDEKGRWWNPGNNVIKHPRTARKPYMKPALRELIEGKQWVEIARKHYGRRV